MNHDTAKVSVIVPIYNAEKYLRQCLDSVTGQTLGEIEIILVNDGSNDSSASICQNYAENDPRIEYLEKPNGGLASARKAGLDNATGKYIGFVDSDDWVELHMYEKMYSTAEEYSADIVLCDSIFNDKTNRSAHLAPGFYDRERIETEIFPHALASFNTEKKSERIRWSNCVRLYSKQLIDRHNISFDVRFRRCQDLPFTFECTIHATGFYYLGNEYLYHNRPALNSLSRGYTEDMWDLLLPLMKYLDSIVRDYALFDFSSQMSLRALMFAANCIENEAKPSNRQTLSERLAAVRNIVNDAYTRKILSNIDASSVSRLYRAYRNALKYRSAIVAYLIAYYRLRNLRKRHNKTVDALL